MSYYIYKDSQDILCCNQCHSKVNRNKHGKHPKACPACKAKLKKDPNDKIIKIIAGAQPCPQCKNSPTLLTATDYTYTDNAYAHHRLACLNCGGLKTNLHYSLKGVEAEWNALVNNYKE